LPAAMKPLRIALRKSLAESQARYDAKAKPLYDKLTAYLEGLQKQLTKEQKLANATKVKEFREAVVAEMSPGKVADEVGDAAMLKPFIKPLPVPIPAEILAPPPAPKFTRELAEWITKAKAGTGYVAVIDASGKHYNVGRDGTLPEGDFTLTVVDSGGAPPPDFKPEWLVGQTKLRTLNLYEISIPDPIVLRGMTELEGLRYSTSKTDATDKTMEKFSPLPKLKYLVFYGGGCGKKTVQIIAERCPEIRQLELSGVGGNGCLQMLSLLPKLDNLTLSVMKFSAEDEKSLERFTSLKRLQLNGCSLGPTAIASLKSLTDFGLGNAGKDADRMIMAAVKIPTLSTIRSGWSAVKDDCFPALATASQLKDVNFINCPIKGRKLAALAPLKLLKSLKLEECPVDDTGLHGLPALPALETLVISRARELTDESIVAILRMPQLQHVGLWGCSKLTDTAFAQLAAGLKAPIGLHMGGTALTDACLPHLEKMPSLEAFTFDHTEITAAAIPFITKHPGLKEVHVPAKNFTEAQVAALKAAKPGLAVERK